ncbi:hypothetical protein M8818_005327 [Zalaria obscura]|uniref:Uncharacterized protein n=1 Tax=Zalaria obscura TaxID=2024903 RepID=A0ACC3SA75_9PEZI
MPYLANASAPPAPPTKRLTRFCLAKGLRTTRACPSLPETHQDGIFPQSAERGPSRPSARMSRGHINAQIDLPHGYVEYTSELRTLRAVFVGARMQ